LKVNNLLEIQVKVLIVPMIAMDVDVIHLMMMIIYSMLMHSDLLAAVVVVVVAVD
jgi:hypothetical protein